MGNAQTTAMEATFLFLVVFSLSYALGILIAYRVFVLVHKRWFPCSHSNRSEPAPFARASTTNKKKKQQHESWYERLQKPPYFPGTLAYIITWAIVFFLQAYTLWRIMINVPAFNDGYGFTFALMVFFYWIMNGVASELLFGVKDLTWAVVGYGLAALLSIIALVMAGLLTWQSGHKRLPSPAVFALQCVPTAESLIMVILVCVLRGMNPDQMSGSSGKGRRHYQEVAANGEEMDNMGPEDGQDVYNEEEREAAEEEQDAQTGETRSFWPSDRGNV